MTFGFVLVVAANIRIVTQIWDELIEKENPRAQTTRIYSKFLMWSTWIVLVGLRSGGAIATGRQAKGLYITDMVVARKLAFNGAAASLSFGLYLILAVTVASFKKEDLQ